MRQPRINAANGDNFDINNRVIETLKADIDHAWGKYDVIRRNLQSEHQLKIPTELTASWQYMPFNAKYDAFLQDICLLLKKHLPQPQNMKLIDLGAGTGISLNFLSWYFKFRGYGVELIPEVRDTARNILAGMQKIEGMTDLQVKYAQGNFFPANYAVSDSIKWGGIENLKSKYSNDPYRELGMDISQFDIIYFYQFERNSSEILQMLSEKAKIGAIIVCPLSAIRKKPHNLQLVDQIANSVLLKKTS